MDTLTSPMWLASSKAFSSPTCKSCLKEKTKDLHTLLCSLPLPLTILIIRCIYRHAIYSPPDRVPCPRRCGVFSPAWDPTCSRHSANTRCIREQRNAGHQPSPRGTLLTNPPVTLEEPLSSSLPTPADPGAWLCQCCAGWWLP